MRWLYLVMACAAGAAVAAASCTLEGEGDGGPPPPPPAPVCGNAITELGEECDRYADPLSWSCPADRCSTSCTCGVEEGGGGVGGVGAEGGNGGVGAGLPIGGPGQINCEAASGEPGALKLTPIVGGLDKPVLAIAPAGEGDVLYLVEQTGKILRYEDGAATLFLDLTEKLVCCGERGLLGLAFHPSYLDNGRFFVHYSAAGGGDTAIEEYARDPGNPHAALPDPIGGGPFLWVEQPAGNHNGGSIEVSEIDGHLYVALGDGGGANDTFGNGQNLATRLGKILRIDIEQSPPVAAGNYPGADAYVWDIGLRNPWRVSFDRCNGNLYIGDVGQGAIEEIDVELAGVGHHNYGWNVMEGTVCFNPPTDCEMTGLTLPVTEYQQVRGNCSVTGGYVYRGDAIPWLRGTYFYGDFCSGRIWSFVWDGAAATNAIDRSEDLGSLGRQISSFGQDASGEVYVLSYSDGELLRIEVE